MTISTEDLTGMAEGRHVFGHKDGLELAAELLDFRKGQTYRYIGADGQVVLARDMEDELLATRAKIEAAVGLAVQLENLLSVYSEPDQQLCCDGRMCGCQGATVHQEAEHYAKEALAAWEAAK